MSESWKTTMTLRETRDGNPPEVLLGTVARRPDGCKRGVSVMAVVPDKALFARLKVEAPLHEEVTVTLAPNEGGSIHTYALTDFERVEERAKAAA